jgi:hypothetical protein
MDCRLTARVSSGGCMLNKSVPILGMSKSPNRALAGTSRGGCMFLEMTVSKTFMAPMANNGQAINQVMNKAMETIYKDARNEAEALAVLKLANAEVARVVKQ